MTQPAYTSDAIGNLDDSVSIQLGSDQLMVAESWDVHEGMLEQPMTWNIRVGWGGTAAEFLAKYPNGTPYSLRVGGVLQSSGWIDGRRATGSAGATQIILKGRDPLAAVHDTYVDANQSFTDSTYTSLVWRVLSYLGLVTGTDVDPAQLATSNEANRQVKAGKIRKITQIAPPRTVDQILTDANGNDTTGTVHQEIQANVGETWLSFLRRYLDPAGLILWAAADGTFVLSAPNTQQQPLYCIVRRAVGSRLQGNVVDYDFEDDATHRHSEAVVYGRGGGRKSGRSKAKGAEVDDDLFNNPTGRYEFQPISFRESNVQNIEQAENYARRKLAEERRNGWVLRYTIAGHTLPVVGGGGQAVVTPDTVVQVYDEELGLNDNYYVESVERSRKPQTVTTLRLCRLTDIIIGAD